MENKNHVRVIAATLDKQALTLYTEAGSTIEIPQGDPRLKRIVEEVMPAVLAGQVAEIDLTIDNAAFAHFEKQSNGLVRFFKVAKSKLSSLFGSSTPQEPVKKDVPIVITNTYPEPAAKADAVAAAVHDVMTHLEPLTDQDEMSLSSADTMVAVVNGEAIAGVESLKPHLTRIQADEANPVGVQRFLERLSAVIQQRRHSVDDLMTFLKKADLPITDDGCILAYKVLRQTSEGGVFVDCHTGRVRQKVGSYVHMDPALVDHDRRRECSHGLHIARRDYIGNFSGNACVLVKVRPEDVIAVPEYDASKMRVCGYHILSQVSDEEYRLLRNNKPFTEQQSARITLAKALRGEHIGVTQLVKITGEMGQGVEITDVVAEIATQRTVLQTTTIEPARILQEAVAIDPDAAQAKAAPVDPTAVAEQVSGAKGTRVQQAQELLRQVKEATSEAARQVYVNHLLTLKKTSRQGWAMLGIDMQDVEQYLQTAKPLPVVTQGKDEKVEEKNVLFIKPEEILAGRHDAEVTKQVTRKKSRRQTWEALGIDTSTGLAMLSRFAQMNAS